jgi:hypothetical protein
VLGCSLSISVSFSSEEEKKTLGKNETRLKTNTEIKAQFRERVQDEIENLINSTKEDAIRDYYKMIREKQENLRKINFVACDTNFLEFNVDLAKNFEFYRFNQA